MDRVRFGRALGYGARHAAKSLVQAVDAAAATRPVSSAPPSGSPAPRPGSPAEARTEASFGRDETTAGADPKAQAAGRPAQATTGVFSSAAAASFRQAAGNSHAALNDTYQAGGSSHQVAGARHRAVRAGHLHRSLWSPLARFSRVVWLQVTGTFFTLIALFLSQGLWKQRGALHLPVLSPEAEKLYLHAAAFAIFAYFAVSSFVRAHLRQRR